MRRFLALALCISILTPSIALAADDESRSGPRLNLSGTQTTATLRTLRYGRTQNAPQQSRNDDKLLGMNPFVTFFLVGAGIGAGIGAIKGVSEKDTEGKAIPDTADHAKGALVGAAAGAAFAGVLLLAGLAH